MDNQSVLQTPGPAEGAQNRDNRRRADIEKICLEITNLVVDGAGQAFDAKDFRMLLMPGVYVLMLGDECLYVGMSRCILDRVGSGRHHCQNAINECSSILMYPCVSVEAANKLENILIEKLFPKYNKRKTTLYTRQAVNKLLGNKPVGFAGIAE